MNLPLHKLSLTTIGLLILLLGGGMAGQAQYAMQNGAEAKEAGWLKTQSGRLQRSNHRGTPMNYGTQRTAGFTGMGFGALLIGAGIALSRMRQDDEEDQI